MAQAQRRVASGPCGWRGAMAGRQGSVVCSLALVQQHPQFHSAAVARPDALEGVGLAPPQCHRVAGQPRPAAAAVGAD
eukprot:11225263-Lingulodinium_polyedra.AAC.1